MSELSTNSILSLFQTSKSQRLSFVNQVMEGIENGTADPLKVHLQIRGMEDIINSLTCTDPKKNKNYEIAMRYKKLLLDEAEKNGKKFTLHNAEFSLKEVGTKYDYSVCEDPEWNELNEAFIKISEAKKAREATLQTFSDKGLEVLNKETGEIIIAHPPSKSSTTSVTVSLK